MERADHAPVGTVSMTPNAPGCSIGTRMPATVSPAPSVDVLLEHLPRVHPVDVVGAENADMSGLLVGDQVRFWKIASAEPANQRGPEAHLRRHGRHVVAEQRRRRQVVETWRSRL